MFASGELVRLRDRGPCSTRLRLLATRLLTPAPALITVLDVTDDAVGVSEVYVREGITPVRYRNDALRVALAVCHALDVVVSWNMKHLVNVRKVQRINAVNLRYGLPAIRVPHRRRS